MRNDEIKTAVLLYWFWSEKWERTLPSGIPGVFRPLSADIRLGSCDPCMHTRVVCWPASVDVRGFRTNATPCFIRPAVPPSRRARFVIDTGIQCLVLRLFSVLIQSLHFFCLNCCIVRKTKPCYKVCSRDGISLSDCKHDFEQMFSFRPSRQRHQQIWVTGWASCYLRRGAKRNQKT